MGEPIRFKMQRDVQSELFRKLQTAPAEHAAAILSAYELLQEAHDHGVLDTLRGALGAGEAFVSKAAEYANTPEGIRTLRNLLALGRVLGEIDPSLLDAVLKALGDANRRVRESSGPPSLWHSLRRLTGPGSRRMLASAAEFAESFGTAQGDAESSDRRPRSISSGAAVPVLGATVVVLAAALWMTHRN